MCVFQSLPQPDIFTGQGSQPSPSRPGAKSPSTPNRVSGTTPQLLLTAGIQHSSPGFVLSFFRLCSWLEKNTPLYYSECVRVVGPLMEHVYEKAKAAAIFLSETALQLVLWVREKTPQVIDWVSGWSLGGLNEFWQTSVKVARLASFLCTGLRQHSRQCFPAVGLPEGAAPPPPSGLHPPSAGLSVCPSTESVAQPAGLLQVSTLRHRDFTLCSLSYLALS